MAPAILSPLDSSSGVAAPTVFFHKERQLRCAVHGEDFTFLGFDRDLDFISDQMSKWYEVKVRGRLDGEPGGAE